MMNLKLCPTCRTWVFEDMDTCYACMYRFGTDPAREAAVLEEGRSSEENQTALCFCSCAPSGSDGDFRREPPMNGMETRSDRQVVSLAGWNVLVEAMGPFSEGGRLHLVIEPASREAGSGKCEMRC